MFMPLSPCRGMQAATDACNADPNCQGFIFSPKGIPPANISEPVFGLKSSVYSTGTRQPLDPDILVLTPRLMAYVKDGELLTAETAAGGQSSVGGLSAGAIAGEGGSRKPC